MQPELVGGVFTVVGVVIGFGLAELAAFLRTRAERKELRRSLDAEIDTILRMIPHRQSNVREAINAYRGGQALDTTSTHFPRSAYEAVLEKCTLEVSSRERDCLHLAYERLRVVDAKMDSAIDYFNAIAQAHSPAHATQALVVTLQDMDDSLPRTAEILQSIVNGDPIEVL